MVCLDTEVLVELLRENSSAKSAVDKIEKEESLSTTIISVSELMLGAHLRGSREVERVKELCDNLEILYLDRISAEEYGRTRIQLRSNGEDIPPMDALIASICISSGETLLTRDKHFARINGLKTRKW